MDKDHELMVQKLKSLLEPFTDELCHISNIKLANITSPFNIIPLSSPPEEWRPLISESFVKDRYQISSWGRIYDIKLQDFTSCHLCDKGYIRLAIANNQNSLNVGYTTTTRIHRLVANAFIPNPEGKDTVNHIDTIKRNNCVENLEWMTNLENLQHAKANGCRLNIQYSKKFTREEINDIRERSKNGQTFTDIAKIYNKKHRCISDIVNNKTYADDFWDNLGFGKNGNNYRNHLKFKGIR